MERFIGGDGGQGTSKRWMVAQGSNQADGHLKAEGRFDGTQAQQGGDGHIERARALAGSNCGVKLDLQTGTEPSHLQAAGFPFRDLRIFRTGDGQH